MAKLLFDVNVRLTRATHPVCSQHLRLLVEIDQDDEHPEDERDSLARAAIEALKPFCNNLTHLAVADYMELGPVIR